MSAARALKRAFFRFSVALVVGVEGGLVVLDGLVQVSLVLGRLLAGPELRLVGAAEVEHRLRHRRVEIDGVLVVLDGLLEVLFLVGLVAVLEGGPARTRLHPAVRIGAIKRRARACDRIFISRLPGRD